MAADSDYNEYDSRLNDQFIYGLDDKDMMCEILKRSISARRYINDATSEWVLLWAQRVQAKGAQKETLDNIKQAKDFD